MQKKKKEELSTKKNIIHFFSKYIATTTTKKINHSVYVTRRDDGLIIYRFLATRVYMYTHGKPTTCAVFSRATV